MGRWAAAGGMCLEASGCEHCQQHQKLGERMKQTLPQSAQRTTWANTLIWTSDLLAYDRKFCCFKPPSLW